MLYIFEDKRDDMISRLFRYGYSNTDRFIYAEGNGNIIKLLDKNIITNDEEVYIILDMIYDNPVTSKIYRELCKHIRRSNYVNTIIFPITCAEQLFIKSLDSSIINKDITYSMCIDILDYRESPIIETEQDRLFCKNFEKFCKLILIKDVADCAKHTRSSKLYGVYYNNPCLCDNKNNMCKSKSLTDKSISLLEQYPCIPLGLNIAKGNKLSMGDCIKIHRDLVDKYNAIVHRFRTLYCDDISRYRYIQYLK